VVWPYHQRCASVKASHIEHSTSATVQTPPALVLVVYEGLVLGKASKALTALMALDSPKLSSSRPRSWKPDMVR
jgi:hypothetical protein